jgi:phosphatidylglycerol:prolipoprotein diacylglycerol transferase
MMAIAFLVATYVAARRAEKEGIPSRTIFDLGLYILVSALLGARVFHILQHPGSYNSFLDLLKVWQGGLAYYGGFILAFIVSVVYLRWNRLSIAKVSDILGPSLILGLSIGRIGCFLAGCCFGKPTSLPWGVTFPEDSLTWIEIGSQRVHPTQLYSVVSLFSIFIVLTILRKHMKFSGQLFLFSVLMYSIHRFLIDFLRYYTPDERIGSLATSQVMSMVAGAIALAFMIVLTMRQASRAGSVRMHQPKKVEE